MLWRREVERWPLVRDFAILGLSYGGKCLDYVYTFCDAWRRFPGLFLFYAQHGVVSGIVHDTEQNDKQGRTSLVG